MLRLEFMEWLFIAASACFTSIVTFYSGFGLATLLMPVLAIFFPVPTAIFLTAIVHVFHNAIKSALLRKSIDYQISLRFGLAGILGSIPGALALYALSNIKPLASYTLFNVQREVSILHAFIGVLLIAFATLESIPKRNFLRVKNLFIGGLISGFFGGLSGNQGAFRSLFLLNYDLNPKTFIGTNALIAVFIDIARLILYLMTFGLLFQREDFIPLLAAVGGAFVGILIGFNLIEKVTLEAIHKVVCFLLYLFGISLLLGLL